MQQAAIASVRSRDIDTAGVRVNSIATDVGRPERYVAAFHTNGGDVHPDYAHEKRGSVRQRPCSDAVYVATRVYPLSYIQRHRPPPALCRFHNRIHVLHGVANPQHRSHRVLHMSGGFG